MDTSLDARRAEVRAAVARGELFEAFDLAEHALADFPDDPVLCWVAALSLARAGATKQARARYEAFHLADLAATASDAALRIDIESLDARIAKDEAFAADGAARVTLTKDAAARYEAIFRRSRNYYPGVNAATLSLLAGDTSRAEALAKEVLAACSATICSSDSEAYFVAVTEAEAALILGDPASASRSLSKAALARNGDLSAFATTRRQLKMVCAARAIPLDVAQLQTPTVVHYTGHLPGSRFPKPEEGRVRLEIAEVLERRKVGIGYGSLAAGADILFAEELLNRGAEVNVTMPFNIDEFKQISVACGGDEWLPRFDKCLAAAKTVTYATVDEYLQDDSLFAYASTLAMGLALLRASFLDADVGQIGVWDGAPSRGATTVGTAGDVEFWRSRGLWREIIDPHASHPGRKHRSAAPSPKPPRRSDRRTIRAMLFGDIKGFSQLREAQLPIFAREVLGRFARVLDRYGSKILFRNTWGDGLYAVASDVETAALCAIDLQEEMATLVPEEHGLPQFMGLRLGGHLGPVFAMRDPVLKRRSYMGAHVSRTARIEPITPEGSVYVTEAFAAAIATDPSRRFACEYVGQVPTAKHYGTMRMYSLRRLRR